MSSPDYCRQQQQKYIALEEGEQRTKTILANVNNMPNKWMYVKNLQDDFYALCSSHYMCHNE